MPGRQTLLTALLLAAAGLAAAADLRPMPALSGHECMGGYCLGDELAKYPPGALTHPLKRTRSQFLDRGSFERGLRPMFGPIHDDAFKLILDERVITEYDRYDTPLTPAIHAALLKGPLRACRAAGLVAQPASPPPGTGSWALYFRAVPGRMVGERQAWLLTSIAVNVPGVFTDGQLQALRQDLTHRIDPKVVKLSVQREGGDGLSAFMTWFPFKAGDGPSSDVRDLPTGEQERIFGCREPTPTPKL
ncbi:MULTISPECIES: hypothetical protein [Ramlibacter]|uniref:Uncharacterized protein n=1 Tax=Ramlibacter aquaticus TaxID=2780094 RepID=A0ABR9SAL9_9BURK|nr:MULTISPECIES: hypothetical protein [Ramlibacter]MBE7939378.1 hypothetical protein [Ramlibacter aquaticus]